MANSKRSLLVCICILFISITGRELVAQPLANFTATPVSGCSPLKVDFINNSTGAVSYTWAFGNGNSSSLVSPSAVYNASGKFNVTLIATDANGLSDTLILKDFITVFRTPKASFSVEKQTVCAGDTARFTDVSILGDGPVKSFKWDFGNGGVSYEQNPKYIYSGVGTYDITFAIVDSNGCQSSVRQTKFIQSSPAPTGDFTADRPNHCKSPVSILFSATAQGSGPIAYSWSFGDGGTGSGPSTGHTYNNLGAYTVILNITDGSGCVAKIAKPAYIQIKEPTVDFSAQQVICAGQKVGFQNQSLPIDGAGRFHWDFGNGDTASAVNPEVTFSKAGVYSVSLTYYWDNCVVTTTKTAYITVSAGVVASIQPRDTAICWSKGQVFNLSTRGNDYSKVIWTLQNGQTMETSAPGAYPFKLDTTNGTYWVKATMVSSAGCKSVTDSTRITIRGPKARIGIDKNTGCIPFDVNAFSLSKGSAPIVSYKWEGQGIKVNSNQPTVSFTNDKFGKSSITLTVVDADGCTDWALMQLAAGIPIDPVFTTDKKVICSNEPLMLINHTKNQSTDTVAFLYGWTGTDSLLIAPGADSFPINFRYMPGKNVKVSITANSFGCIRKTAVYVDVLGPYLNGGVKILCDVDSLVGVNKSVDYTSTYWTYKNEQNTKLVDSRLTWRRPISNTKDIWLYAFNDNTKCKDSMPIELSIDPQDVSFTHEIDCGSGVLLGHNGYISNLHDTFFRWTLTNTQLNTSITYKGREFKTQITKPGPYRLELKVKNPSYACTRSKVVNFTVKPVQNLKGSVDVDRTTCYPVTFTLQDNNYNYWKSAKWIIGGDVEIKDDSKVKTYSYIGNKTDLEVYLMKTDSMGCSYTDTFRYKINGFKADISYSQDNTDCLKPIVKLQASVSPIKPNAQYLFSWDFGYKKSTKYSDTIRMNGSGTINASLMVTESGGCKSQANATINVKMGKPVARFITSDTLTACPPLNVTFTDVSESSYGPITSRTWNFGDQTFSDKINPGKLYIVPGKYEVSLIIANESGCKDTFSVSDLVVVKGPYGTYSIDKMEGCAPLRVNMQTTIKGNVNKFDFDMGDGNVFDQSVSSHIYLNAGTYIPRLILMDSAGCKYSPEPKDTIRVYQKPVAMFNTGPLCLNQVYKIPHTTICEDSVTVEWSSNNQKLGYADTLPLILQNPGKTYISLKVTSEHKCVDSITKPVYGYGIRPKVSVPKEEFCLGDLVKITDLTSSDTTIVDKKIWISGNLLDNTNPWNYIAATRGRLPLKLEFTDAIGCNASFSKEDFIRVGDTVPPPALTIYRTSVNDNVSTETKFSASLEPDFKSYNLYIEDNNVWKPASNSEVIDDSVLLTFGLNTVRSSYCHVIKQRNFCGVETSDKDLIKHCTIEVKAEGDTNTSVVSWSPYIGWNRVEEYKIWRKRKEEDTYTYLNTVPGNITKYVDSSGHCNVEYDFQIEGFELNGYDQNSWSDTARSKPIHFIPVPAPEVWRTTVEENLYTHTEWVIPVAPKFPVKYYSVSRDGGVPVQVEAGKRYFDDMETDVQQKNYVYTITATDVCDVVSPASGVGRNILLTAGTAGENQDAVLSWTPYIYWNEGVQDYRVERSVAGGDFMEVGKVDGNTTTFTDNNLPKTCVSEFQYRVVATRNQPVSDDSTHYVVSVSNNLNFKPEIRFFIPSAFTPNGNNLNEGFRPDGMYFSGYEMKIYNRYGQKLYENSSCMNSWDGRYMGEDASEGVYAYYIEARDVAGKSYKFNGTLHLIR